MIPAGMRRDLSERNRTMKKVAVIMGSDSDFPVVKGALTELKSFGVPFEAHVMSAHRTPALAAEFAEKAAENGFGVIICAAGMAAHLAGVIAGHTTLPVIGIPCRGAQLDGLDALLATVMMPSGIPVECGDPRGADARTLGCGTCGAAESAQGGNDRGRSEEGCRASGKDRCAVKRGQYGSYR